MIAAVAHGVFSLPPGLSQQLFLALLRTVVDLAWSDSGHLKFLRGCVRHIVSIYVAPLNDACRIRHL